MTLLNTIVKANSENIKQKDLRETFHIMGLNSVNVDVEDNVIKLTNEFGVEFKYLHNEEENNFTLVELGNKITKQKLFYPSLFTTKELAKEFKKYIYHVGYKETVSFFNETSVKVKHLESALNYLDTHSDYIFEYKGVREYVSDKVKVKYNFSKNTLSVAILQEHRAVSKYLKVEQDTQGDYILVQYDNDNLNNPPISLMVQDIHLYNRVLNILMGEQPALTEKERIVLFAKKLVDIGEEFNFKLVPDFKKNEISTVKEGIMQGQTVVYVLDEDLSVKVYVENTEETLKYPSVRDLEKEYNLYFTETKDTPQLVVV